MRAKKRMIVVISYVVLILVALISIFPLVYAVMIATKKPVDAFSMSFKWIYTPIFDNFKTLWIEKGFTKYLYNTVIVTCCCVLISVPTATLGAYGLIRNGGKFATRILNSTLLLRMFPQMLLAIPYFIIATNFGLADTKFILVVIVVASNQPFALWLMRGFLITIPPELDEAARIDGCNMVQTVTKVILPVAKPGIATASIFTFLLSYNEYLLYQLSLYNEIIKPEQENEEKLFAFIDSEIQEKDAQEKNGIYSEKIYDIESLLMDIFYLLANDYILNADAIMKYSDKNIYIKFIIDNMNIELLDVKWINDFPKNLHLKLNKNDNIKNKIKEYVKSNLNDIKTVETYFRYYC